MNDLSPNAIASSEPVKNHASIYKALAAAQSQMGKVLKDGQNTFFKKQDGSATPYATLQSVIEACLPAFNSNGIAVFQPLVEENNHRYIRTILAHESGETLASDVPLILGKNDMQGLGSAMTYARRYGLMAMAGIAPDDDDGNAAAKSAPVVEDRPKPVAQEKPKPRDPIAIRDGLVSAIGKTEKVTDLDNINAEGSRSAAAWQWLEDEHPTEAAVVKRAFDAKRSALTDAIPY